MQHAAPHTEQSVLHVPTTTLPPSARPASHRRWIGGATIAMCVAFIWVFGFPSPATAVCPKSHALETLLTKVCWGCVFPFRLGGMTILSGGGLTDPESPKSLFCNCPDAILPGIPVGYSEPARLIEVVREPFCFPSLEGLELKKGSYERHGDFDQNNGSTTSKAAFYHVHYIAFPIWNLLGLTVSFLGSSINSATVGLFPDLSKCFYSGGFDVSSYSLLYLSELDPTWNDDEFSALLNPEAILFANPIAQAVCAADCVAASAGFPLDPLFWCAGCQGSMYPFTGTVTGPVGEVDTAALVAARTLAKMNRGYFEALTSTSLAMCGKIYSGFIRKSQYRMQLLYPQVAVPSIPGTAGGAGQGGNPEQTPPDTKTANQTKAPYC